VSEDPGAAVFPGGFGLSLRGSGRLGHDGGAGGTQRGGGQKIPPGNRPGAVHPVQTVNGGFLLGGLAGRCRILGGIGRRSQVVVGHDRLSSGQSGMPRRRPRRVLVTAAKRDSRKALLDKAQRMNVVTVCNIVRVASQWPAACNLGLRKEAQG